jgi:hypothetical protein
MGLNQGLPSYDNVESKVKYSIKFLPWDEAPQVGKVYFVLSCFVFGVK